ncbi:MULTISPECIES: L-glutamate gamma-semialdehyde dehydrogenase [unclassified Nocardioides]|uniref:L-glutamate gamma-semialdehyde dehydrogenase n=1 Tax=unclassified Nocardioides TaxID=2615069 RepID=UPI0006F958E1|nr:MULTISPECIES: L-glutamate gamma-semialdehyde dehydrogenase [unclassified Nocardioides]KRA37637.1 1-pyrroline-5-carboxylate dehydrogenase [Nocardioides sp. Root614]KRA91597.1 1-pyrroline-5-carboxylate dehydrogenase [Nocardioides sp. Root682]
MDAITTPPVPVNEPNLTYAPGSAERAALTTELETLGGAGPRQLDAWIGGEWVAGGGDEIQVVQPHAHQKVLGVLRNSTIDDSVRAIDAARAAAPEWRGLSFDERAAVLLRAAELLAGPWRQRLNAATVLGQSKTSFQAEIDAACELIDFWRFNVHFGRQILAEQPIANSPGIWNRTDHRPLEGFVYAISPFNFTAIAGNLPTAPALMGNTVIWKPSPTQQLAASLTMELLTEAGMPPGVINMLPGDGLAVSEVALTHPDLAGIHFTGSTGTFQRLWSTVGTNLPNYRTYPRLVGETGGKDFVIAHPSADPDVLRTALIRGAFEYSGQKCSAASRAYVPRSLWERMGDDLAAQTDALPIGDPADYANFTGAVIDARAFAKHTEAMARAHATAGLEVIAGGTTDDSVGWFVRPTIVVAEDPTDAMFWTEYFGPILVIHVYDDRQPGAFEAVVKQAESAAPYALTGSILATDRRAIDWASRELRFAAGNFYVNDKPTGAVVGQQPFGGGRASGTNDKAGSPLNLLRWTSPRSIKETLVPPKDHHHSHQG